MVSLVEMALDDIIKTKKKANAQAKNKQQKKKGAAGKVVKKSQGNKGAAAGRGPGGNANRGQGSFNRGRGGMAARGRGGASNRGQKQGGFRTMNAPRPAQFTKSPAVQKMTTGPAKMQLKNLHFGVSDKDIKDLFSEFGQIRNASIHYDSTGKSLGTGHVTFDKGQSATKAIQQYNNVQLDGRPMRLSIEGQNTTVAKTPQGSFSPASQMRGGARGGMRGGARGGFQSTVRQGQGKGKPGQKQNVKRLQGGPKKVGGDEKGKNKAGLKKKGNQQQAKKGMKKQGKKPAPKPITKEQLDKEMEAYLNTAKK